LSIVPVETRLILNERVLPFPYGQGTPESVLQAAFELGKKSASLEIDANPFLPGKRKTFVCSDRYRGAETVAWLRGHYLASKAMMPREAA